MQLPTRPLSHNDESVGHIETYHGGMSQAFVLGNEDDETEGDLFFCRHWSKHKPVEKYTKY